MTNQFTDYQHVFDLEQTVSTLKAMGELIAPPSFRDKHPAFPWDDLYGIVHYDFDYSELPVLDAIILRQYHALFSKLEHLDLGINKEERAYLAFLGSEMRCRETNRIFGLRQEGKFYFHPSVEEQLLVAQRKISEILGDVPELSAIKPHFGPGANTRIKKQNASIPAKLSWYLACSEPMVNYLPEVVHALPRLFPFENGMVQCQVDVDPGNLQFVPKNAKTYRSIVVEPPLAGLFQLGLGEYMFNRLHCSGIDLRDQTLNQRMAQRGSLTGDLATLDLSSASDSVAYELVAFLLPHEWFWMLRKFRSSSVRYKGHCYKMEKFSSMGNGFTFPLESLIFYALAYAVAGKRDVSVYGDDIIVPSDKAQELVKLLQLCGFVINTGKSFIEGPFRESCGADYLKGINIRPIYQDTLFSCADAFRWHNELRGGMFDNVSDYLLTLIPDHVRLYGPKGYGDGHLVSETWGKPHKRDLGWSGYTFETWTTTTRLDMKFRPGDFLFPAYSIYARESTVEPKITKPTPYIAPWMLRLLKRNPWDYVGREATAPLPKRRGRVLGTFPGAGMVKRIKIYTLDTPINIG